ncbi:MAG: amino acid racemase [Sphaerochaetaceae bacterium]|jgi:aspartate racemase
MDKAIGIIGGVGPYAGLDLVRKVFDHTNAKTDQEHIDLYLVSCPSLIPDRTEYLLHDGANPAGGLSICFGKLAKCGATAIAVACNTAHAPKILDQMLGSVGREYPQVRFVNMIDETCKVLQRLFPDGGKVGLLATMGTHQTGVYRRYMERYEQLELVEPDAAGQGRVHAAIYDRAFGIKAKSPVSSEAKTILRNEAMHLVERGAGAIVLGCTELPLALSEDMVPCNLIDPTDCVARALVLDVAPEKFKE